MAEALPADVKAGLQGLPAFEPSLRRLPGIKPLSNRGDITSTCSRLCCSKKSTRRFSDPDLAILDHIEAKLPRGKSFASALAINELPKPILEKSDRAS